MSQPDYNKNQDTYRKYNCKRNKKLTSAEKKTKFFTSKNFPIKSNGKMSPTHHHQQQRRNSVNNTSEISTEDGPWQCSTPLVRSNSIIFINPKRWDVGDTPTAQEFGCHFSGNDSNVLKLPDFFKIDVWPKVKESFWAYLE